MKETAGTSHPKDFKPADLPEDYINKCFACGAPSDWPHDICDACQKLAELNCT
jgi:hypothetical protein